MKLELFFFLITLKMILKKLSRSVEKGLKSRPEISRKRFCFSLRMLTFRETFTQVLNKFVDFIVLVFHPFNFSTFSLMLKEVPIFFFEMRSFNFFISFIFFFLYKKLYIYKKDILKGKKKPFVYVHVYSSQVFFFGF